MKSESEREINRTRNRDRKWNPHQLRMISKLELRHPRMGVKEERSGISPLNRKQVEKPENFMTLHIDNICLIHQFRRKHDLRNGCKRTKPFHSNNFSCGWANNDPDPASTAHYHSWTEIMNRIERFDPTEADLNKTLSCQALWLSGSYFKRRRLSGDLPNTIGNNRSTN